MTTGKGSFGELESKMKTMKTMILMKMKKTRKIRIPSILEFRK
jgi:hypothetical protein